VIGPCPVESGSPDTMRTPPACFSAPRSSFDYSALGTISSA